MQHPGQTLHVDQIAEDTGLTASQVRGAIRHMIEAENPWMGRWDVAMRGVAWVYHPRVQETSGGIGIATPKPKPGGNWILVEVVGSIRDTDNKLVRAEDGSFAILKPIDL